MKLVEAGELTVSLRHRDSASLADQEWIGFEFENSGEEPIFVYGVSYRIESERHDPVTGGLRSSGSLASGDERDLFREAWMTRSAPPLVIPPGIVRVFRHPSDYSSAILELPPAEGWRVTARLSFSLWLGGQARDAGPRGHAEFSFHWASPDATGVERMRSRLRSLMADPARAGRPTYIFGALLDVMTAADLTNEEILAAISVWANQLDGRRALLRCLERNYPDTPTTIAWYLERLRAKDERAAEDLASYDIWSRDFVLPLVETVESAKSGPEALRALAKHGADRSSDPEIPARLSASVLRRWPILLLSPDALANNEQLRSWADAAELLAMTGDSSVVPLLEPFLDRPYPIRNLEDEAFVPFPYPATRVCDVALEAILALLEDEPRVGREKGVEHREPARPSAGSEWVTLVGGVLVDRMDLKQELVKMEQLRDAMIVELRARLEEMRRSQK